MTDAAHRNAVEAWRRQRYAALRGDIGWLTLAGLGWLKPGINHLGTDPGNDVVLPSGPSRAGTVTVGDDDVIADGDFMHDGEPATRLRLVNDQDGDPTLLGLGPLRLCVIERGGRLAIRTWDTDSAARRDFEGIEHWPVDSAWRLEARFAPTPDRVLLVPDVLGTIDEEPSPGEVAFEIDGITASASGFAGWRVRRAVAGLR